MFGLLNSSQIYGFQQVHEKSNSPNPPTKPNPTQKQRRSSSNASDTAKENKFLTTLSSAASNGMKSPTNFIEKFIRSELLSGYDTIKNYKNSYQSVNKTPGSPQSETVIPSFNCLHGSYRSSVEGEFYEAINVNANYEQQQSKKSDMIAKSSSTNSQQQLQQQQQQVNPGYQKLSDSDVDFPSTSLLNSSGASSGEFNSSDSTSTTTTHTTTATNYNNLFRKMQNGSVKVLKNLEVINGNGNEITSDNSSSSISTTTNSSTSSSHHTSNKSNDLQRTSSSASSGQRERKKSNAIMVMTHRSSPEVATSTSETTTKHTESSSTNKTSGSATVPSERSQRRKLMQMISNYDQQNKLLQLELAKEKRRRNEELACVVKSLLCFESKLKTDMKSVNQRLLEKDAEICRLVRQNRALRKQLQKVREVEGENTKDEGVVEDGELMDTTADMDAMDDVEDCLVLEALQCNNCRKQFYDIDLKESFTQTGKDGSRNNDDHTTELGSSSDDTVSSSFYGARRSVRYTSKRTSGTFRDYMRSRSMNIDDDDDCPSQLENNSEENTSSISRNDSHRSYEKMNIYSRTIERMHGVKGAIEMGQELRSVSRASNKSCSSKSSSKSTTQVEEDDGIFSPTQDEDYEEEEEEEVEESFKATKRRSLEFSEASPKQVYEISTDDWYASASDQEDTSSAPKSYAQNAVNPVLECVNQILLQQSMEEPMLDDDEETKPILRKSNEPPTSNILTPTGTPKTPTSQVASIAATSSLPRRSSLSGRRSSRSDSHSSDSQPSRSGTLTRKRVHFSTKNSMVHVPRNEDMEHEDEDQQDVDMHAEDCNLLPGASTNLPPNLAHYHPMNFFGTSLKAQSPQSMQSSGLTNNSATPPTVIYAASPRDEHLERLDALNYESIYSNEYEPIGSEHNSSNLYVDMESNAKQMEQRADAKLLQLKMPPALPPKPANLLKFKKSLQQLDEMPDEHLQQDDCAVSTTTASEPDYCSILEVNMGGMRNVQIKADVHKAPESEPDLEQTASVETELECQASGSVHSDDTCAETHKTDEIEEIFADIPKLPNVAAIIAPKQSSKFRPEVTGNNDHYLLMSPKLESGGNKKLTLSLNTSDNDFMIGSGAKAMKSPKIDSPGLTLQLSSEAAARQYKRKHVPNILAEINKRMYNTPMLPNSPSTPIKTSLPSPTAKKPSPLLHSPITPQALPLLQAEFDWYNLDAEYGKSPSHHHSGSSASSTHTPDILKASDNLGIAGSLLEEIHEDHESVVAAADEYNLDEEFSLTSERPDMVLSEEQDVVKTASELPKMSKSLSVICEAVNFPLFSESSPQQPQPVQQPTKAHAKKMRKNLANFEKFIEGSGLSTKTLPSKRKIYFAGPFV